LTSFHGADGAASRHGISQQWPSVRGNDDRLRLADASEFRVWAFAFRFLNSEFCILPSVSRIENPAKSRIRTDTDSVKNDQNRLHLLCFRCSVMKSPFPEKAFFACRQSKAIFIYA